MNFVIIAFITVIYCSETVVQGKGDDSDSVIGKRDAAISNSYLPAYSNDGGDGGHSIEVDTSNYVTADQPHSTYGVPSSGHQDISTFISPGYGAPTLTYGTPYSNSGPYISSGINSIGGFGNAHSVGGFGGGYGAGFGGKYSLGQATGLYGNPYRSPQNIFGGFGGPYSHGGFGGGPFGGSSSFGGSPFNKYNIPTGSYGPPSYTSGQPFSSYPTMSFDGGFTRTDSSPAYAVGIKGLGHYTSAAQASKYIPYISSKPSALTGYNTGSSLHTSFGGSKGQFRPSAFLGSSHDVPAYQYTAPSLQYSSPNVGNTYLPSYNQQSEVSVGSSKQSPTGSYLPPSTSYGVPTNISPKLPSTMYGVPSYNTINYSSENGH